MSSNFSFISVLFVLTYISLCQAAHISPCGNPSSNIGDVSISGCSDEQSVCPLKIGTNVTLSASFTTASLSNEVNVVLHGIIGLIPIPFPISPSNACGNYGLECPLQANKQYDLQIAMPIAKTYPPIAVTVQLELKDEKNDDIICFRFPAKIVA